MLESLEESLGERHGVEHTRKSSLRLRETELDLLLGRRNQVVGVK
jgi:hypothetical protein